VRLSNDTVELVPRTSFEGPELRFELDGLAIGVAEYDEGPTGCTVFLFADGAHLSADVRGGSPGIVGGGYEWTNAICLAGGSLYGLEATSGVAAELLKQRGYATGWTEIPLVTGAIIFDYGPRDNAVYPDKELGRAAVRAARPGDPRRSARRSSSQAARPAGRAPRSGSSGRRRSRPLPSSTPWARSSTARATSCAAISIARRARGRRSWPGSRSGWRSGSP
jgi:hypothetical protein